MHPAGPIWKVPLARHWHPLPAPARPAAAPLHPGAKSHWLGRGSHCSNTPCKQKIQNPSLRMFTITSKDDSSQDHGRYTHLTSGGHQCPTPRLPCGVWSWSPVTVTQAGVWIGVLKATKQLGRTPQNPSPHTHVPVKCCVAITTRCEPRSICILWPS